VLGQASCAPARVRTHVLAQIDRVRVEAPCAPALPVGGGPHYPEWFREDFRELIELLRRVEIHPVVAERVPLSDARRAHEMLESSAAKGKLVLVP